MLKRNKQVIIRLTESEYAVLRNKADIAGMKISPLIRRMITDCKIKPRPPDMYKDLVREIAAFGNNLNQIAHVVNSTGYVSKSQMEQTSALMVSVWKAVQKELR